MQGKDATFVRQLAASLDRFERLVLSLYYVEELTATEIGLVLNEPSYRVEEALVSLASRTRCAARAWDAAVAAA